MPGSTKRLLNSQGWVYLKSGCSLVGFSSGSPASLSISCPCSVIIFCCCGNNLIGILYRYPWRSTGDTHWGSISEQNNSFPTAQLFVGFFTSCFETESNFQEVSIWLASLGSKEAKREACSAHRNVCYIQLGCSIHFCEQNMIKDSFSQVEAMLFRLRKVFLSCTSLSCLSSKELSIPSSSILPSQQAHEVGYSERVSVARTSSKLALSFKD